MEPAVTRQRHVSFYLEAMFGHQSLPVPAGGQLEVMDSPGHSIGAFPRQPGERYSWYLCPCQKDPVAWRVSGPADFHCKLCKAAPEALMVCTCGVVSPVEERPACGWCSRDPNGASHACRGVAGGLPISFDGPACPLCGEAAVPPAPPSPAVPAPAQPAAASPPPMEPSPPAPAAPAPSRAAAVPATLARALPAAIVSRLEQAARGAAPRPRLVQPASPPAKVQTQPVPAGAAAPQQRKRSATARLAAVSLALALGVCLAWIVGQWYFRQTTYGRALTAIERGELLEPPGSSAIDLHDRLAREEPGSANLQDLGRRITAVLRPRADAQLHRFYAESADDIPWAQLAASYAFLARTAPQDREALARQRYCGAQVAFSRGDYVDARNGYQAALDLRPQWALAWNGLGRVHVRAAPPLRDYEAARREYLAAHQADPRFIYPLVNLAGIALLLHRTEEAPGYLREAIAISPRDPKLYRELGQVFVQLHQKREAIRAYQECLRYATDPVQRGKVESALRKLGANPAAAAAALP